MSRDATERPAQSSCIPLSFKNVALTWMAGMRPARIQTSGEDGTGERVTVAKRRFVVPNPTQGLDIKHLLVGMMQGPCRALLAGLGCGVGSSRLLCPDCSCMIGASSGFMALL